MIVSILPIIFPFAFALLMAYLWKILVNKPFDHWAICLLVGVLSFFFFAPAIIIFVLYLVFKYVIFNKEDKEKQ